MIRIRPYMAMIECSDKILVSILVAECQFWWEEILWCFIGIRKMGHMICRNLAKLTFKRESGFVAKGAINCHNEPLNLDIMPKSIDKNASFDIYAHEFSWALTAQHWWPWMDEKKILDHMIVKSSRSSNLRNVRLLVAITTLFEICPQSSLNYSLFCFSLQSIS
mgnify:CR=1 FL=1